MTASAWPGIRATTAADTRFSNLEHYLDVLEKKPGAMAGSTPLEQWRQAGRWPECMDRIWKKLDERHGKSGGTREMITLVRAGLGDERSDGWSRTDSGGGRSSASGCERRGGGAAHSQYAGRGGAQTLRHCVVGRTGAVRTPATGHGRLRSASGSGGDSMKNQTEALEHASVRQYCKAVRVPAIAANFVSLAEQAVKENQTHIHYLEALLQMETEERDRHAIANRTRDAQLPRMKTLEEFDFAQAPLIPAAKIRELAEGGYIERSEPVVLIGECGTGKSHLATGLCLEACRQKRRVRFTTAAALVNELVEAKHNNQVRRMMARWQRYELIAVDEVGYVPLADVGAEFLFQVISERAEKAALIVTTNLLCGAPHNVFVVSTTAALSARSATT